MAAPWTYDVNQDTKGDDTMNTALIHADVKRDERKKFVRLILRYKFVYFMIIPAVLLIFIFNYIPLFGWVIAFKHYSPSTTLIGAPWAGLENFRIFFSMSADYAYTIRNTLVMNFGVIIVNLTTSFILAILLYEFSIKLLNKTVQIVSLFPYFISWTIVYALIYAFFAQSSGVINQLLMSNGIINKPINVLGSPKYSWTLIILANMWKYIGYNAIMFVAAIAGVEREQFEAAEIDGAGRFAKVWHVLIPHLIPTLVVMIILNSGGVFNSDIGMFMLFGNATNWETMEVLDIYIYKFGMQKGNYSYATAVGIIKSIISLSMVFGTNWLSKKLTDKSIF